MSPLATRPRAFIETASLADAGEIAEIHARSFPAAWSEDEFTAFIDDNGIIALVIRVRRRLGKPHVAGFIICRSAGGEAEILTVAVDPANRGKGYGRSLIEEAMRRLYHDRIEALFLEVDETNVSALHLYRALGFVQVAERKAYYADSAGRRTAALVMRFQLR